MSPGDLREVRLPPDGPRESGEAIPEVIAEFTNNRPVQIILSLNPGRGESLVDFVSISCITPLGVKENFAWDLIVAFERIYDFCLVFRKIQPE